MSKGKKHKGSGTKQSDYYEESESFNKRKADKWEKSRERDKKKTQQNIFLD